MSQLRIGDILVGWGVLERSRVEAAAALAVGGKRLGQVLIDLGLANDAQVAEALAHQLNIPFLTGLQDRDLRDLARYLPEHLARTYRAVPVELRPDGLLVALYDPTDFEALRVLERTLGVRVIPAVAPFYEVLEALEQVYAQGTPGELRRQRIAHDMVLFLGRRVRVTVQETTGRTFLKMRTSGEILDLAPEEAEELFTDLVSVAREHAEIMRRLRAGGRRRGDTLTGHAN